MTVGRPRCLRVTATAENSSKAAANNVDVFGRVYAADGSSALDRDEASDAGRISNIAAVPPGVSDVTFSLITADDAKEPLSFVKFKAVAYPQWAGGVPLLDEGRDCDILDCSADEQAVPP